MHASPKVFLILLHLCGPPTLCSFEMNIVSILKIRIFPLSFVTYF